MKIGSVGFAKHQILLVSLNIKHLQSGAKMDYYSICGNIPLGCLIEHPKTNLIKLWGQGTQSEHMYFHNGVKLLVSLCYLNTFETRNSFILLCGFIICGVYFTQISTSDEHVKHRIPEICRRFSSTHNMHIFCFTYTNVKHICHTVCKHLTEILRHILTHPVYLG